MYIKIKKLFCTVALFSVVSCSNIDEPGPIICPNHESRIFTFAVDYTGNEFLGGYQVLLPQYIDTLEMVCKYKSPGDFGDVAWFDKITGTELFAGTIVWMGKGVQTYPEQLESPESYTKLKKTVQSPTFIPLYHDEYQIPYTDTDYESIWKAINNLQDVSGLNSASYAYIYLYQPSVGAGDPADWYWLIFLKY